MKLSLILEAIDRASRPLARVRDAAGGLGQTARSSAGGVGALDRQLDDATRAAERMGRELDDTRGEIDGLSRSADNATGDVRQLDQQMDAAARKAAQLDRETRDAGQSATRLGRAADGSAGDVGGLGQQLDRTAGQADRLDRQASDAGQAARGLGQAASGAAGDVDALGEQAGRAAQRAGRLDRDASEAGQAASGLGRAASEAAGDVRQLDRQATQAGRSADRLGREANDASDGVRDLGRQADRTDNDVLALDRSQDRATRSAGRLERGARGIGAGLVASSRRGIGALAALERRMSISQGRMEKMAFSAGSLIGSTIRGGVMAGGAIAGAGLSAALYKIVTAGLMFEKFQTQLNGLEGSAEAGGRAMQWITTFAAKTPYELDQVTQAFIALKAYGIDPTDGTLRSLGDAAAGMGYELMQAVEMIADAQTGEFERIKAFGIRASVAGDKVTLKWQRNGREMSKTIKQTSNDIRTALLGIMDEQFAGGMDRLSRITAGKWANLMDTLTTTAAKVWQGGFGEEINKQLDRLTGWIAGMEKDGSLKKWASETGKGLGDFVAAIGNFDWVGLSGDLQTTGKALSTIAAGINDVGNAARAVRGFIGDVERLARVGGSVSLDPRGGLRYNAPDWMRPKAAPPKSAPKGNGVPFMDASEPQPAQKSPAQRRLDRKPVPMADATPRAPRGQTSAAVRPLPTQKVQAAKAQPVQKNKLEIAFKTQPGTTARVTKVSAPSMDIETNTGRAMGAFA